MGEIDDAIRDALAANAEPPVLPDPAALAGQLRSRALAAPASTSPRGLRWPIWAAIALISGGGGLGVGLAGWAGGDDTGVRPIATDVVAVSTRELVGTDCPGGSAVGEVRAGDRVLALRAAGSAVEIRDPLDLRRVMWVERRGLVADDGDRSLNALPSGGCASGSIEAGGVPFDQSATSVPPGSTTTTTPTATSTPGPTTTTRGVTTTRPTSTVAPSPAPGPGPAPQPTSPPAGPTTTAAPDTTKPVLGQLSVVGSNQLCESPPEPGWPTTITYRIAASDNVGVVSVQATWPGGASGLPGSPVGFSLSGGQYQATVGPFPSTAVASGSRTVTVTITARDAVGNQATTTTSLTVISQGDCLA